ncbi:hypothetical protein T492DRAFT_1010874 [Pavlovales sp. CCMP2436]|nr:hypothetical protein T492DRAFT_1010874 [Pavlovales sp. CCMP2436]
MSTRLSTQPWSGLHLNLESSIRVARRQAQASREDLRMLDADVRNLAATMLERGADRGPLDPAVDAIYQTPVRQVPAHPAAALPDFSLAAFAPATRGSALAPAAVPSPQHAPPSPRQLSALAYASRSPSRVPSRVIVRSQPVRSSGELRSQRALIGQRRRTAAAHSAPLNRAASHHLGHDAMRSEAGWASRPGTAPRLGTAAGSLIALGAGPRLALVGAREARHGAASAGQRPRAAAAHAPTRPVPVPLTALLGKPAGLSVHGTWSASPMRGEVLAAGQPSPLQRATLHLAASDLFLLHMCVGLPRSVRGSDRDSMPRRAGSWRSRTVGSTGDGTGLPPEHILSA